MAGKSPTNTRDQAFSIQEAWKTIGESETFGTVTLANLSQTIADYDAKLAEIEQLNARLKTARNERDQLRYDMWQLVKRARTGVKADRGDDSSEYEAFGGTRVSERKPHSRSSE